LISFRFAVAAAITGSFSLADASLTFLEVAAGGFITGIVIALGASAIYHWLVRWIGDEPGTPILISILIPFAAYLAAEHLGLSGIFAAVAAGISIHYAHLIGRESAIIRMRRTAIWDMLQVALNGIIFVLLGLQLRTIIESVPNIAHQLPGDNAVWLAGYVIAITLGLAALRFIWVWASLEGSRLLAALHGKQRERPSARFLSVAALSGVKGAVTLAGILTLPLLMPDGTPFPARELAIFLAMGVILLSLLAASAGLPVLTKNLQVADSLRPSNEEQNARNAAVEAAIQQLEEVQKQGDGGDTEIDSEAVSRVIEHYQNRLDRQGSDHDGGQRISDIAQAERGFRVIALRAERDELYRMRRAGEIDDSVHQRLVREIDLGEASLSSSD
jgi:CPA1 family monovalent cation:H+ antiporter